MNDEVFCPVCNELCGAVQSDHDADGFNCPRCGRYDISRTAMRTRFSVGGSDLTYRQKAVISHRLQTTRRVESGVVMLTEDAIDRLRDIALPSRSVQAANLIRLIGDVSVETGGVYMLDQAVTSVIGAADHGAAGRLLEELIGNGYITRAGQGATTDFYGQKTSGFIYDLTLAGWEQYEGEQRGQVAGHYGFLAMKFNAPTLDDFADKTIKPAVHDGIGYDLVDLRDVAQAGIIDNLLRAQIRDAAFVLVDLTHDNSGAYWEAGYAEGLGKPVIYLCERSKFEERQTHFDTNHCTTVLWAADSPENFRRELVATLRRSLNLFPDRGA